MLRSILSLFEPFILMLLGTVALASLLPARGDWATMAGYAADGGIVLLFFLHGAKLSRDAIWEGARNWRLHLAVLATTFVVFPLCGLALAGIPHLAGPVAAGLLFLTLLPSTVQSSIAFTAIARGNVAAAVCSASFSNLIGIVLTPALVALLMGGIGGAGGGISLSAVEAIVLQLLVPFVAGHLSRPWTGGFVARRKALLTVVDRGSILLVVYTAFGAAVVEGLWHRVSGADLALIALICTLLLGVVLLVTWLAGRALGFAREDAIVLLFCGSKKSLASGVPMAGVLFPAAQVGVVLLPVMLFHQIQLIACAVIARRYADAASVADATAGTGTEAGATVRP
ncbi:bile acid:sodium symporter [Sphingomonas sp. A2-49]|uniref:bile acid:sodium symporter family protein n=1 Tax=Sphingomonas sp. A2-49 TaxID=1391375 RepID=UPI0021D3A0CD|nr:bile acid:sodium symporter family protein [Sphingomonas sp. A2-49]MCU6452851.1 bile acid:sodium symporter [Sphingomonas sp. A2-49]